MVSVRLAALAAAAVALLAPLAAAASTQGQLEAERILLPEGASLTSDGVDYVSDTQAVPTLALRADRLHLERVGTQVTYAQGPAGPAAVVTSRSLDAKADHMASSFYLSIGADTQLVVLRAAGPATVDVAEAAVRPVARVLHATTGLAGTPAQCVAPRCLDAAGAYEIASATSEGTLEGDFTLLLRGPVLHITDASGTSEYASGITETRNGALTTRDDAWLVVTATGVQGTLVGTEGRWYAATPVITAPRASFDAATGSLAVGALQYRARDDRVLAAGALTLTLEPTSAATRYDPDFEPLYGDAFTARIAGDVAEINLRASSVYTESPSEAAGILALLVAAGVGLAYYWPRIAFAGAALYTRLKQPEILENEVRSNIYAIVRRNPGISARAVHRESAQSWGTVVYHLRQLERHHLVMSRALGRTRNYYESQGNYRGMEAQLACLQSDRALALARAILTRPGITQEQLVEATGFPQPTTSYYVRKLKQAKLIEEGRDGRYAKYLPHADLARYIELADTAALPPAPPSGVNA